MAKKKKTNIQDGAAVVRGEVKVTTLKNGVPIKTLKINNNAVSNMLVGIARFIRGDFLFLPAEGVSFIPAYLGVGYTLNTGAAATSFTQSSLANELDQYTYRFDVSKEGISLDTSNNCVNLNLRAVIPSGALAVGTRINEVGLFAGRQRADSGMLARVVYTTNGSTLATERNDSTAEHHIKIEQGMSYQIDWTIKLSNK